MTQTQHTPTPWGACHKGKCSCKQIWSIPADHPVAKVISGKWGDEYPSLRLIGSSLDRKAEPYMDIIEYGEVGKDLAEANAEFIVRACNSHDELVKTLENISQQLGRAFVSILQGDYSFIDEMARSNKIKYRDGEPYIHIPILKKARGEI